MVSLPQGPENGIFCKHLIKIKYSYTKPQSQRLFYLNYPPQRRQGSDLRPLWQLVGTPSAIRPEPASRQAEYSLSYSDVCRCIYFVCVCIYFYIIYYLFCVYRFLSPLRLVWLLVCFPYKEVYLQNFKCVSFWLHGCCTGLECLARKPVNNTSWITVVTTSDGPKSVLNRCLIEIFDNAFVWNCPNQCHYNGFRTQLTKIT